MQVNPQIQYNQEDAGLTLDVPEDKSIQQAKTSDTEDEADLVAVEKEQQELNKPQAMSVRGSQVICSPGMLRQLRKNDRLIAIGCMAAGVISVVVTYFAIIFI